MSMNKVSFINWVENMVHVYFMPSFWLMLWQLPLMLEASLLSCKQLINNKNKTLKMLLYVTYTKFWRHLRNFYDCFTVSNMIICLHLVSCLMFLLFHLPLFWPYFHWSGAVVMLCVTSYVSPESDNTVIL